MNILIVTHVFPPLNVIGAQRTYSWAKYWSRLNHSVCVLTTQKESFDGVIDVEFDFQILRSVKIEEIKYWPFGKGKTYGDTLSELPVVNHDFLGKVRAVSKKIRQQLGMGSVFSVRNLWIGKAVRKGVLLHAQHRFDCIVSSYGPPAPHLVASQLQKKLQIPWIADYRDLWHGNHYQDAEGFFSFIQKSIEDRTVARASLLTTVSNPLRDQLAARFNKETLTIENGFDVDEVVERSVSPSKPKNKSKISVVYTGTVRKGKQCVLPLFQAIEALNLKHFNLKEQLEVLFYGRELGEVPYLIDAYGLDEILKLPGFINRNEVLAVQRSADALLFLDWKDTSIDGILSGKIFEYLHSGTPVLGIGSYQNLGPGCLLKESGCGLCLGDSSEEIESVLTQLILRQPIPYSPKSEVLEKYSRQKLAERMIDRISEIVSG